MQTSNVDHQQKATGPVAAHTINALYRNSPAKDDRSLINKINKINSWTERVKFHFLTHEGRLVLAELFSTLLCVILQHVMGTCEHYVSDGLKAIKWHVFVPPFGAGPHTATYFFVLSWTVLVYCIQRIWTYLIINEQMSKKRNLILQGFFVILYLTALGFNIWGYILCESTSQVNASKIFSPGVCRGESQACIPLIAGVLTSCLAACTFFAEHIFTLVTFFKTRHKSNGSMPTRIIL